MGEDALKNEEVGLAHFTKGREEAMKVAETVGIEIIAQPCAVTLGGIKDLNNRTPLLARAGNPKGIVKGVINPGDECVSAPVSSSYFQLQHEVVE